MLLIPHKIPIHIYHFVFGNVFVTVMLLKMQTFIFSFDYPFYIIWQWGIKTADRTKVSNQMTLKWENYSGLSEWIKYKGLYKWKRRARKSMSEWHNMTKIKTPPSISDFEDGNMPLVWDYHSPASSCKRQGKGFFFRVLSKILSQ